MSGLNRRFATPQRRLAGAALVLGLLALVGDPIQGHVVTLDTQELATIVAKEVDHVAPAELADWIVRGASDYRLVDLRAPEQYAADAIPGAENIPIAELPDWGLARNEKIVLYSNGGIHAAQAWMLLRAQGYRGVTILRGGLEAWKDEVLHPIAPVDPTPQQGTDFARAAQLAAAFGGAPRVPLAAAGEGFAPLVTEAGAPRFAAPTAPKFPPRKPAVRKKREGC